MSWKNLFRRKKDDSPYGKEPLFGSSALPLRREEEEPAPIEKPKPVHVPAPAGPDWELRRFELAKMIVAQERRSVVLGKLKANDKQIAAKARSIADAAIKELITHPFKNDDECEKTD